MIRLHDFPVDGCKACDKPPTQMFVTVDEGDPSFVFVFLCDDHLHLGEPLARGQLASILARQP